MVRNHFICKSLYTFFRLETKFFDILEKNKLLGEYLAAR